MQRQSLYASRTEYSVSSVYFRINTSALIQHSQKSVCSLASDYSCLHHRLLNTKTLKTTKKNSLNRKYVPKCNIYFYKKIDLQNYYMQFIDAGKNIQREPEYCGKFHCIFLRRQSSSTFQRFERKEGERKKESIASETKYIYCALSLKTAFKV